MTSAPKKADLYRMVRPGHLCPYGLKALHLLKSAGFEVEDHHLESEDETEAFKAKHGVTTTPQIWIDGNRIGGYDAAREHLGRVSADDDATSYRPVVMLFLVALALAAAAQWAATGTLDWSVLRGFVAVAMTLLALLKLQDVESFSTTFLNYDLLARRWVPYSFLYPYAEAAAGVLMFAGVLPLVAGPVALFVGAVGAVSVCKAVYLEKRELKCACVGGNSNVPLGFVSLTENLAMVGMGSWALIEFFAG